MNFQLTTKEKKVKRAKARRRAILWSEREIRKRNLKQAQARVETISISEPPASVYKSPSESDQLTLQTLQSVANLLPNEDTVSSLQPTIKDLKIQRQELDITIKVLSKHLEQFLQKPPSKSLKRSKPDGC